MLLHGDGVNAAQNNTFLDGSTNNFTVTRNGNTTQGSFNPFVPTYPYAVATNGGSGYFDGTGDYLTVVGAGTNACAFGTGNFTVECWVYLTSVAPTYQGLFDGRPSEGAYPTLVINGAVISWYTNASFVINGATLAVGQWYHIAVVRQSGSTKLYVNGTQAGSTYTDSVNYLCTANPFVGAVFDGYPLNGYMTNLRIVKGTAVYTTAFTPPTAPLTAVTNTSLLLGFTNGAIFDNTEINNLETLNSAQISTSVFKYGTGSIRTNSGNSYLSTPIKNQLQLSGDFTVECWAYVVNDSAYATLLDCSAAGGYNGWFFEYSTTRGLVFATGSSGVSYTTTPALNTWTHLAATRQSGTIRLFINGTLVSSGSVPGYADASLPLLIGAANGYTTIWYFDGYIDDIRITNGIARYVATFTPPTAAFPNS
jgi:hypothetical protein